MGLLTYYINGATYASVTADNLAAFEKSVDTYEAVDNLLTTLATGLLAALGFLLTSRPTQRYAGQAFWPAAASALCACVSLYWGYISSQNVEWAIERQAGTLDIVTLQWPRQLQFVSMLLGVIFLADLVRRTLVKMNSHEGPTNASKP